ncbi:MAG TPA: hypothetical protein VJ526_13785 [Beijerinckiaceae bacterium]|nr:hypothetical protein [Beijerinckiaceae bacterium]
MTLISRRQTLFLGGAAALPLAGLGEAFGQGAGDPVRKIILYSDTQGAVPQSFQAAQLIAQAWRQLGLDVEVRPTARQQLSQVVWYERERWDATMWRMVGRPERSDPDELVFNLFHSSTAPRGFNFVGYKSPEYDRIAEQQRQAVDIEARKKLIREAQAIVSRDAPYAFLIHPKTLQAFNQQIWDASSIVIQKGVGIRNFWTFVAAAPKAAQRTMIQLRHAASGDPPALHRRRPRQLGQRARLGPARARRAGRAATPLGGGELHLRQRPHRRRDDPRRHDLP